MRTLAVGRWNTALLAWARATGRQGWSTLLAETPASRRGPRDFSRYVEGVLPVPEELVGTMEGAILLARHAKRRGARAIIAASDDIQFWLAECRSAFEPELPVLCSAIETLRTLTNKVAQTTLAQNCGFQLLTTWNLMKPSDLNQIRDNQFPIVLRPSAEDAVSHPFKVHYSPDRSDALQFLIERGPIAGPVLAQPYVHGPNLLIHGVRRPEGPVVVWAPFRVERKFDGVALTLRADRRRAEIEAACLEFARRAEIAGPFHFDLILDEHTGTVYFLEANLRLGGTTDKTLALGYDEASWTLHAYGLLPGAPHPVCLSPARSVNRKAVLKHLLAAVSGTLGPLDYPHADRFRPTLSSLRDLLTAKDCLLDPGDLHGTRWCIAPACRAVAPKVPYVPEESPRSRMVERLGGVQ